MTQEQPVSNSNCHITSTSCLLNHRCSFQISRIEIITANLVSCSVFLQKKFEVWKFNQHTHYWGQKRHQVMAKAHTGHLPGELKWKQHWQIFSVMGTYVPINIHNKCWDLSADMKLKMAAIGGERLHVIFMGNAFSPSSFWELLYIVHPN
jgi:hypothetical protein